MVDYGLNDKVVLITGANNPQGIGATAALAFAREGAKVILVYKRITRAFDEDKTGRNGTDRYYAANAGNTDIVESKLKALNADFLVLERDIADENAVRQIFSTVIGRYGKVDILVNNAADCDCDGLDTIEKISPRVIEDTFAVNVRGTLLMTREFINRRGDYGRVINLSSIQPSEGLCFSYIAHMYYRSLRVSGCCFCHTVVIYTRRRDFAREHGIKVPSTFFTLMQVVQLLGRSA